MVWWRRIVADRFAGAACACRSAWSAIFPHWRTAKQRPASGIGVATGADRVFVVDRPDGLSEEDRLLPLAMARDTVSGELRWSGHYLVDPWDGDTGALVFARRLSAGCGVLRRERAGAAQTQRCGPSAATVVSHYRSRPSLAHDQAEALDPGHQGGDPPGARPGGFYPHHNLYWVTSELWDPQVLGGTLCFPASPRCSSSAMR